MNKVIMIGYAYSKNEVNWQIEDTEYWILNDMYDIVPKFDRLFDIHDDENLKNRIARRSDLNHFEELKKIKKPIYLQREWNEIPYSKKYPLDIIKKEFHIPAMGDKIFMTCSVCFMLALAILQGFKEISLYGIDQAIDDEYAVELPGVLYWLGIAFGKGIKINISESSPLLKSYFVYGYEEQERTQINKQLESELKRIAEIENQAIGIQTKYREEELKCIGARTITEHFKKIIANRKER